MFNNGHSKKWVQGALWIALTLPLLSLAELRIDGSSIDSVTVSMEAIRESLQPEKQALFDEAVEAFMWSQIDKVPIDKKALMERTGWILDGKTADEVIIEYNFILTKRATAQRIQAFQEITELEARRKVALEAEEGLRDFKVVRSRFYLKYEKHSNYPQPVIELSVSNGLDIPISSASFEGTISSPGRSVPWHKDTFSYDIPGGVEPGEGVSWSLIPNKFSDWGDVRAPEDAVFTVTVISLSGPDNSVLYSTRVFTEEDARRLESLKAKYGID